MLKEQVAAFDRYQGKHSVDLDADVAAKQAEGARADAELLAEQQSQDDLLKV